MNRRISDLIKKKCGSLTVISVNGPRRFGHYTDIEVTVQCACRRTFKISRVCFEQGLYESCAACSFVDTRIAHTQQARVA